jgi:hypothetical protein
MSFARTFRILAGTAAAAVALSTVGATAAQARPVKPGGVTGLQAVVTPGNLTYGVDSSWNAVPNATGYQASLSKAGTTLATKTVTGTSWSTTLNTSPGTATLSVKAVIGRHKGRTSTLPVTLSDVTKPTGSFSTTWDNNTGAATLTQDSLTDDSPTSQVTRSVDWGDGSSTQPWTVGTTLNHTYALTPAQEVTFQPTVTLTDAASNTRTVDAHPVVFNDFVAPTGSFGVAPGTAWAKLTKVTITQSALSDNRTAAADIARTVDWNDGSAVQAWTAGTTITHVYAAGGTYSPVVTITDQATNAAQVATSAVTVNVDAVAPVVKLLLPRTHRHSVKAWSTLRGKATDTAGTGVKRVSLRAVEKRGTKWFGYRPATKTWVKSATKAGAFKNSRAFALTTAAHHRWSAHLAGLRKGTLVYRVSAVDRVRNASKPLTHKATLTKP